ncbi:mycofactocin system GMC family oxidoreductase MftG [Nocardia panacis]|uniref:Mycofactocin system GMC family oxidoreductase MftG n=1 Tax=Nocardia panacis TaxID=2340916 RepID=A0A3A4K7N5_9NOCA|nr:mycofactocin system GMC family oxidoreductase MftG [Nocardia panacis]RJO77169.1 mycofactocin system GMC family oxidoreductase MftG [Nocardia panacis]
MIDTLVIGGGTAGCVLAARLSADPDHQVVLLEAGISAQLELRSATRLPLEPDAPWLWRYPVTLAPGVSGNIVRGKVIGGSGVVNGGYFARASAADFAAWSTAAGSDLWSFEAVLPAYRRMESDLDFGVRPEHGTEGPIPVRRVADPVATSLEFAESAVGLGFAEIPDLNGVDAAATGVARVPCNIADGVRMDAGSAYLLPASTRPNLTVVADAMVTRIVFRGARAIGAEVRRAGLVEMVSAGRIVLCAGAVESAALLMRSGVGPPDELRAFGIEVVAAAPVGAWCVDHPEIGLEYGAAADSATVPLEYVLALDDIEIRPYTVRFRPGVGSVGVAAMRPRSGGELRLRSGHPDDPPLIDFGYLSAKADRVRLRAGVAVADAVLRGMGVTPLDPPPAGRSPGNDSWLMSKLGTSQHLSGTCRMGPEGDALAVVDARCAVRGVDGLFVVDLSVAPVPLSRGPHATVALIAERAAQWLGLS